MTDYIVNGNDLTSIANKIRAKGQTSAPIVFPGGFEDAVDDLPDEPVLQALSVTANNTYTPGTGVDGFNSVTVNVQPALQSKTATENGTVTPDQGYDGLSSVAVNVSGGGVNPLLFHLGRLEINSGEIAESSEYCYSDLIPISSSNGRWFLDLARSDVGSFYIGIAFYESDGETYTNFYIRQYENYRSYANSGSSACKYFRIANKVSNLSFANVAFLEDGIFVVPQSGTVYQINPA